MQHLSCTRSNGLKLHAKTNMWKYSFLHITSVVNDWNSQPTIVMATNTASFKTLLGAYWFDRRFSIFVMRGITNSAFFWSH